MPTLKQYLPELNYHFATYWKQYSEMAIDHIHMPEIDADESSYPSNSMFELLFNNNFQLDDTNASYNYLFNKINNNTLDKSVYRRLSVYGGFVETYITDISGNTDIFNISDSTCSTRILLDKLLDYRTGVNIQSDLSGIDYSGLDSNLSKLIYLYLDLNVNGIYQPISNQLVVSDTSNLLENMFELYLINESHKLIKTWQNFIEHDVLELRPIRKRYFVDDDLEDALQIVIDDSSSLPHDTDKISIYLNSFELSSPDEYLVVSDNTSVTIDFNPDLTLKENDVILVDYFVTINPNV